VALDLVDTITSCFVTEEKATELSEFFRDHAWPDVQRAIQQSLEKIHITNSWLKRDNALINDYLMSYE
jgi:puromycin-sensitive aminopeptidase